MKSIDPDDAGAFLPTDEQRRELARLRSLCRLLDEAVGIPGTKFRFGLDSVAGLVPVVGDVATAVVSGYVIHRAGRLGARKRTLARMYGNVAVDILVGVVPVLGDLVDLGWKCNKRNLRLLEKDLRRQSEKRLSRIE